MKALFRMTGFIVIIMLWSQATEAAFSIKNIKESQLSYHSCDMKSISSFIFNKDETNIVKQAIKKCGIHFNFLKQINEKSGDKKHSLAVILAIFLGWSNIPAFYLGYKKVGVVYSVLLLFFVINLISLFYTNNIFALLGVIAGAFLIGWWWFFSIIFICTKIVKPKNGRYI